MSKVILQQLFGALLFNALLCNISLAVAADGQQQIESLQRRAEKLAYDALDPDNYHLAKARTWLDLATSEY